MTDPFVRTIQKRLAESLAVDRRQSVSLALMSVFPLRDNGSFTDLLGAIDDSERRLDERRSPTVG